MEKTDESRKSQVMLKIRRASDLPAMADTVNVVNKFKSSEDTSVTELANILLKDYALTTKLLKVVNSVHFMQSGQVTTISRAIFLLGIEHIKEIAMTLMLFDQMQKQGYQTEIMDAILQAFCGGIIAQKIVHDLNFVEEEEAFICTLLHPLGKIIVAHTMPETMASIRAVSAEKGISENKASASVLGVSYEEIGMTIAAEWNYPQKIIDGMHYTTPGEISRAPREQQRISALATLSNELANTLALNMDKAEKEVKMRELVTAYKDQVPTPTGSIDKLISTSLQDFSKLSSVLDLHLKKTSFNKQLEKWSEASTLSAPETDVLSFKTDSLKSVDSLFTADEESPESIFSKGIQEINSAMLGVYTLNDVIRIALETIFRGMKTAQATRVLFLVRDIKRCQMEVRLGFGNGAIEAKRWFIIPFKDEQNVFAMAIEQDKDLIIKDTDSMDIRKFIPAWYRNSVQVAGYILIFPITINKRNIGLICIEGDKKGFESIGRGHLNYLRILRDQTIMATRQITRPDDQHQPRT